MRHIKKFLILAAAVVGVLALPGSAAATAYNGADCTYAQSAGPGDVVVYQSAGGADAAVYDHNTANASGMSADADSATGACVNTGTGPVQGGAGETGSGSSADGGGQGEYTVIDGDNANASNAAGYAGVSNYENDGTPGSANCATGPDNAANSGTNSGQCHGSDTGPWQDAVPGGGPDFVCGSTSGQNWNSTSRDGCSIP